MIPDFVQRNFPSQGVMRLLKLSMDIAKSEWKHPANKDNPNRAQTLCKIRQESTAIDRAGDRANRLTIGKLQLWDRKVLPKNPKYKVFEPFG